MTQLPIKAGIDGLPTATIPTDPSAFVDWFKNSFLPRWAANADIRNATAGVGVQISGDPNSPGFVGFEEIAGNSVLGNPTGVEGDVQVITAASDGQFLQRTGGILLFGPVAVVSADSISGSGSPASPLELVNDIAAPGASLVYGTDITGVKGWQPLVATVSPFNVTPDTHLASPSGVGIGPNDEFETGSSIDTSGSRYTGATAWTGLNLGSGATAITNSVSQGSLLLQGGNTQVGTATIKGYVQPLASPGTYLTKVQTLATGSGAIFDAGIVLNESATGKCVTINIRCASGGFVLFVTTWSSPTTAVANAASLTLNPAVFSIGGATSMNYTNPLYLQVATTATQVTMGYSVTGYVGSFQNVVSFAKTANFTVGPDRIGLFINPDIYTIAAGFNPAGIFEFLRRIA